MNAYGNLSVALSNAFKQQGAKAPGAIIVRMSIRARVQILMDAPPEFRRASLRGLGANELFVWQGVTFETAPKVDDMKATVSILGSDYAIVDCKRKLSKEEKAAGA